MSADSTCPTCPTCHAPLPTTSDGVGACPRCLLEAGLAGDAAPSSGPGTAPTPEALASHFPGLEVLELLGQGGMGVVYKARQVSLDRVVALKLLPATIASGPGFAERFAREARTMARLDHRNIVRVHEFGETGGHCFLLMEYVDGSNLREVMEAGGLSPREALAIVPQVCDALQYAHDRGVVHRDVKPENVLLDRAGRVRITDFGLAKLVHGAPHEMTITGAGQVMGTPQYMAPEQYRTPGEVDHRADIYSLGVVFYEMLTGDVPMGRFPVPSEKVEVDVRLDAVVLRTLERERELRYQRVDDVRTEVDTIVQTPGAPAFVPAPPPADAEAPRRWSRLAVFGFLCLPATFLVGGLGIAVLTDHPQTGGGSWVGRASLWLCLALFLLGLGLSIAGWVAVASSRGRLRGLGFAIAGTLSPIPVAVAFFFVLLMGVSDPDVYRPSELHGTTFSPDEWGGTWGVGMDAPSPPEPELVGRPAPPRRGPTITGYPPEMPPKDVAERLNAVEDLWSRLQGAAAREGLPPGDLPAFYEAVDAERLMLAESHSVQRLRARKRLGAPHARLGDLRAPIDDYRVHRVHFRPDGRSYDVVVAAGDHGLVFGLRSSNEGWRFVLAPLLSGAGVTWSDPVAMVEARERDTPHEQAEVEVELLWSAWRRLWAMPDVPSRGAQLDLLLPVALAPSRRATFEHTPRADLHEVGRDGAFGLLFRDVARLEEPVEEYRLDRVEVADGGRHGTAVAVAGASNLTFPVVEEAGRWWLDVESDR